MIGLRNIRGERALLAAIDRLTELVGDQRQRGWQANVDIRLDYQTRHMDTEAGGGWTPLSDPYRLQKIQDVGAIPILQYTGRMYQSLTTEGAADYVREESADTLRVGSANPLARYHHEGAGRLPKREVIVITDAEGRDHLESIEESYTRAARDLGFRVL